MSRSIRNIVTGIAEVEQGEPHLAPAIELAQALEAGLHVVHAYNLPDPSLYPNLEPSIFSPDVMQHAYERAERRLEEHVRKITGSDRVRCHARPGPAAPAILDVADAVDADLIIVGATHHGRIARAIMGTTAQRVIRAARVPVLVTGPRGHRIRRVLLTTDLSGLSPRVNQLGMELVDVLAADGDPELRALLVVGYDLPLIMPLEPGGVEQAAERQLGEYLDELRTTAGRAVQGKVRVGDPAREILAEAEAWEADLLVLGTHGRGGALRFLIGSVAESVLRRVECDALVVPAAAVEARPAAAAAGRGGGD